jgi:hypothetical protein
VSHKFCREKKKIISINYLINLIRLCNINENSIINDKNNWYMMRTNAWFYIYLHAIVKMSDLTIRHTPYENRKVFNMKN